MINDMITKNPEYVFLEKPHRLWMNNKHSQWVMDNSKLLAAGVDKSLVDHWGDTALDKAKRKHFGTKEDYEEIIKLLS